MTEELDAERLAFKAAMGRHKFDWEVSKDIWGRPVFKHLHLESMFFGWQAAMVQPRESVTAASHCAPSSLYKLLARVAVALPVLSNLLKTAQLAGGDIADELLADIKKEVFETPDSDVLVARLALHLGNQADVDLETSALVDRRLRACTWARQTESMNSFRYGWDEAITAAVTLLRTGSPT